MMRIHVAIAIGAVGAAAALPLAFGAVLSPTVDDKDALSPGIPALIQPTPVAQPAPKATTKRRHQSRKKKARRRRTAPAPVVSQTSTVPFTAVTQPTPAPVVTPTPAAPVRRQPAPQRQTTTAPRDTSGTFDDSG